MSKKVVVVTSSLRAHSNSQLLAQQFAQGAQYAGNDVSTIALKDLSLQFCIGCLACQRTHKCVLKDSMNSLYDTVSSADVLVLATPIYYYSVSGQLKTFLDRLNPLYGRDNNFRDIYLLATCADSSKSAMDGAIKCVEGFVECFDNVRLAGVIYGTSADDKDWATTSPVIKQSYDMGSKV